MLAKIGAAIAAALATMGKVGNWTFELARSVVRFPFDLFGGGQPMPAPYEPEVKKADILDKFLEARKRAAAVHTLDRDGIDTVLSFCATHREDRPKFVLPKDLHSDVKVALRTMDDKALRALATSGIGRVRKFIDCQPHGIPGVPSVGKAPVRAVEERPPAGMSKEQWVLWKVQARMRRAKESADFEFDPMLVRKP